MTKQSREKWLGMPGNPRYFISNHGRIRGPLGGLLRPHTRPTGHLQIAIWDGERARSCDLHVIILTTFVGPPPPGHETLHWDGNPANNKIWNLRWGTRAENVADLIRIKGKTAKAMFTHDQVRAIRAEYAGYAGSRKAISALCAKYGASQCVIYNLVHRNSYKKA